MKQNAFSNTAFSLLHESHNAILETARQYTARGWAVTPVQFKSKRPILREWQVGGVPQEALDQHFGSEPVNIGIVLGDASRGLVDIDLDNADALRFAEKILPPTDCSFGRPSMPRSHWLYQVPSPKRKEACVVRGKTLTELRGNGHYTVFPGSVHPSGEEIKFHCSGEPAQANWNDLKQVTAKVALATLLFQKWRSGSRHELALPTAGFLYQLGWPEAEAHDLIRLVAAQARDEQVFDRLHAVKTTYETARRGRPICGRSELIKLLGEDVSAIEKWFGVTPSSTETSRSNLITTDAGAADAFADARRADFIFRDDNAQWFKRHGQVFRPISPVLVQGEAKRFMQEQVASGDGFAPARSLLSRTKIDSLVNLSRHRFRVDPELLDAAKHLVGCADGMILDLDTQDFIADAPFTITRMLHCRFDPDANCPRFESFLNEIFEGDEAVIYFVQRAAGYSLSGFTNEQCFFLLIGKGSNGKTTFLNTVQNVLGDYAATTPAHTLMADRYGNQQTNDLAKLVGARFVSATEPEKGQHLAEGKIKRITGGDRIACRELYGQFFEYEPQFKLWIATNDPPEFSGGDHSIARRIRVIEFPVTFDDNARDDELPSQLLSEASGILNWALRGYLDWKLYGLNPPERIKTATNSYRRDNDAVGQFIEACCIEDSKARITARELYDAYKSYCFDSALEPIPNVTFGKELARRSFESKKGRSGNAWAGLRLRNLNTTSLFSQDCGAA